MIEKEEVIVRLKSEIVGLKGKIDEGEVGFAERLKEENIAFQKEISSSFSA
jgi:hypothetical protein